MPSMPHAGRHDGFTLIELMIVVALVGILAAVSYPAYTRHVERAHRAAARAALLEAAQYLERYYATHNLYTDAQLPESLAAVPAGAASGTERYKLEVSATAATYEITARRVQLAKKEGEPATEDTDPCGDLGLNQLGERKASNALGANQKSDPEKVAACWR